MLIGSKRDPSGTQLKYFQMVSLLPDGVFNRREGAEDQAEGRGVAPYQPPRAKQGPCDLISARPFPDAE